MNDVVFSSRVSFLAFYSSEKVLSAQVCPLARISIGSLTEDKDEAGSAKLNKSGHVKISFHSPHRKKAKHWTQNHLTNRMNNYQKNTNLKTFYSTSD